MHKRCVRSCHSRYNMKTNTTEAHHPYDRGARGLHDFRCEVLQSRPGPIAPASRSYRRQSPRSRDGSLLLPSSSGGSRQMRPWRGYNFPKCIANRCWKSSCDYALATLNRRSKNIVRERGKMGGRGRQGTISVDMAQELPDYK